MNTHSIIHIGTRQSPLAIAQTELVMQQMKLEKADYVIVPIVSSGDTIKEPLRCHGGKGLFAKELHQQVLNGTCDIAIHSLKDLEIPLPDGLEIAAITKREDPRDVLILRPGLAWPSLPPKTIIGTSSLRRECMIKFYQPNCVLVPCRGNVQTRLSKLANKEFDGIVLALAGLKRLNLWINKHIKGFEDFSCEVFNPEQFVPAAGQGALAIVKRMGDMRFQKLIKNVNDKDSFIATQLERKLLNLLQVTCHDSIGAYAKLQEQSFTLNVMAFDENFQCFQVMTKGELEKQDILLNSLYKNIKKTCAFKKNS